MSNNGNLGIKLTGILNVGNTVGNINSQLKGIEKLIKKIKIDGEIDPKVLANLINLTGAVKKTHIGVDDLNKGLNNTSKALDKAKNSSTNFGNAVATAFQKFPIWIFTATAFYLPIRGLQDMTRRIIEVDTALTNLQRVSGMTDAGLQRFLGDSIQLSDQLSNKLMDVLTIAEEFSRMGFKDNELLDITESAQVLQNISDLSAEDSVKTLTAAMLNYNIAAEDSVRITDLLNEVDNNFAVSTADLSAGIRKAGSTAVSFGVDIENLVGNIAAIGKPCIAA